VTAFFPQCYNAQVIFKHADFRAAMQRLADRRIEEAMEQGKFDNLPGKGKEICLDTPPAYRDDRLAQLRILNGK